MKVTEVRKEASCTVRRRHTRRPSWSVVFWCVLTTLPGVVLDVARADWLVTRSGELIATDGVWRIEGNQVVFIAGNPNSAQEISPRNESLRVRVLPAGALLSLPLAEIDLPRSERETAARSKAQSTDPYTQVDPLARKAHRESVPSRLQTPPPVEFLEAREEWQESRFSRAPVELLVSLEGSSSDNYFRAPEGRPEEEVRAATAGARLTWRWSSKTPLKSYLLLGQTRYDELPSATSYGAGLRYEGRRHSIDVSSRFSRNRRALDIGESFEAADMLFNQAVYALRSKRWEWRLIGQFIDQDFDQTSRNDGQFYVGGSSLLYRGFGRMFAPEIGTSWAQRVSVTESQDYSEQDVYLSLRFSPIRRVVFDASVEDRYRSYDTLDVGSSNYERSDTRRRWTLESRILMTRKIAWQLAYSRLEGDSTREGRAFTSNNFSTGLSLKLSGSPLGGRSEVDAPRVISGELRAPVTTDSLGEDGSVQAQGTSVAALSLSDHLSLVPVEPWQIPDVASRYPASDVEVSRGRRSAGVADDRQARSILRWDYQSRGAETMIQITADGRIRFSTFSMVEPARFVVDLIGVMTESPLKVPVGNGSVGSIRAEQIQAGSEPVVRIVFDLESSVKREFRQEANSLTVRLRPRDS